MTENKTFKIDSVGLYQDKCVKQLKKISLWTKDVWEILTTNLSVPMKLVESFNTIVYFCFNKSLKPLDGNTPNKFYNKK